MDDLFFATFAGIVQDGANDPLNPTAMGLSRSGVSLLGQVSTADFDYFYVPVPSGMRLSTIKLTNYSAQVPATNIYIQKGTQFNSSQDPSAFVLSQPFGYADIGKVLPIVSSTAVSNGVVLLISQNGPAADYAVSIAFEDLILPNLPGTSNAERLNGSSANDRLMGLAGNDTLNGGSGVDVAIYQSFARDYSLAFHQDGTTSVRGIGGAPSTPPFVPIDDIDTLIGVERLQFLDKSIAIDLDGNAGNAARTLATAFSKDALKNTTYAGIAISLFDQGMTKDQVSQVAIDAVFGANPKSTDVVKLLWKNLFNADIDASNLAYYSGLIDSKVMTAAQLTTVAADLDLTAQLIDLAGLSKSGWEYVPFGT